MHDGDHLAQYSKFRELLIFAASHRRQFSPHAMLMKRLKPWKLFLSVNSGEQKSSTAQSDIDNTSSKQYIFLSSRQQKFNVKERILALRRDKASTQFAAFLGRDDNVLCKRF